MQCTGHYFYKQKRLHFVSIVRCQLLPMNISNYLFSEMNGYFSFVYRMWSMENLSQGTYRPEWCTEVIQFKQIKQYSVAVENVLGIVFLLIKTQRLLINLICSERLSGLIFLYPSSSNLLSLLYFHILLGQHAKIGLKIDFSILFEPGPIRTQVCPYLPTWQTNNTYDSWCKTFDLLSKYTSQ